MSPEPLPAELLYRACDISQFAFQTTAELEELPGLVGQARALDAISFAVGIESAGFNLFVMGPQGAGKHTAVRRYLEDVAARQSAPDDWVYVNNFKIPHRPIAMRLPCGEGTRLKEMLAHLIEDLKSAIPALFENDEYEDRRRVIDEEYDQRQEKAIDVIKLRAQRDGIALIRTPYGFSFAPMHKDEILSPEAFQNLDPEERRHIEKLMPDLQKELEHVLEEVPKWERERRERLRDLKREFALSGVTHFLEDISRSFSAYESVKSYLEALRLDIIEHVDLFLHPSASSVQGEEGLLAMLASTQARADPANILRRYSVNLVVDNSAEGRAAREYLKQGAPVVYEDNPTMTNLIGRIEHLPQMGALVTDFTLIKAGALHLANGGYLLLDARRLLTQPLAWEALKRCLRAGEVKIESPGDYLSPISTVSLEPQPIPLDVKLILFGDRELYYLLTAHDAEFSELFKVPADFDDVIDRETDNDLLFARLLASIVKRDGLRPLDREGVARVIERSARLAEDAEKLSLIVGPIADLIREADYLAARQGASVTTAKHVDEAVEAQIYRHDRIREHSVEAIGRDIILIDTEGEKIGQANALSVLSLGAYAFGKPNRVTARVSMGTGHIIDIEREAALGGPRHSKGVLILSGYVASHYCPSLPLSLRASLVFEQSYGGIDGDSASLAELLALLSAIAQVPLRQAIAVTGAVNQYGDIQAVGGVNEKIEGFYDVCARRGLNGEQGAVIPHANIAHLMLHRNIVDASERGAFSVYTAASIEEAIEIMTGMPAGRRGEDNRFPAGSFNARVEERLRQFVKARQDFARPRTDKDMTLSGTGLSSPESDTQI